MTGQRLDVWLTTAEAAAYCRMSTRHLLRYATSGRLEGEQLVRGGRWRFHIDQLDAFLRGHWPSPRPVGERGGR